MLAEWLDESLIHERGARTFATCSEVQTKYRRVEAGQELAFALAKLSPLLKCLNLAGWTASVRSERLSDWTRTEGRAWRRFEASSALRRGQLCDVRSFARSDATPVMLLGMVEAFSAPGARRVDV